MFDEKQLLRAVERGTLDEIRNVLKGEDSGCTSCIGTVCLCRACAMNRKDIVELLLQYGAKPNYQPCNLHVLPPVYKTCGMHPERGCDNNYWQAIQLVNVNENRHTPPVNTGNSYIPQRRPISDSGNPVANSCCSCPRNIVIGFRCLQLPLIVACSTRRIDLNIVRQLVDSGASVNAKDASGLTALHAAAESQGKAIVGYLLEHGAQVDGVSDFQGKTALTIACAISKDPQVIQILLAAGSDVNAMGMLGQRPLYEAILNPFIGQEAVQILLDAGADVQQDYYMMTATIEGSRSVMETLHRHGALIDPAFVGKSALHAACKRTSVSADRVLTLLTWGADVNRLCPFGLRPLEYACRDFQLEKVRILMGWGADLNLLGCLTGSSWSWHLDWCNQYIAMMKLLVAGGMRVDNSLCDALVACVGKLPGRKGFRAKVISFLKSLTQNPPKLSHLCRLTLRSCLSPRIDENVQTLDMLPESVRYFLCLNELIGASNSDPSKRKTLIPQSFDT
ncbi:serine/threonine-protein phosphatase 6 regulatory ankyrin repeat subunit A-like [Gigantopelta aegis]|uniref:serine/threonine-protein phosphatase 6 regulatory ankyrin repeat subunit A-like n=1 Tax=Gigantopelta aegis TaxID=1735272 RepID=UPI001B88A5FF|nr:serine/threonine-protein phosphatase 6 regulatory ankyrin repeat subunit A-like [Gigantopelta aegis]